MKHLIAILILGGFGYLWYQRDDASLSDLIPIQRQASNEALSPQSTAEAPLFDAQTSDSQAIPAPIPHPETNPDDLLTHEDLVRESEITDQRVPDPPSIWDELAAMFSPKGQIKPSMTIAQQRSQSPPDSANTNKTHIISRSSTDLPMKTLSESSGGSQSAWKQMIMGQGSTRTMVILDASVTRNSSLLVALVQELRAFHADHVIQNPGKQLNLLLADPQNQVSQSKKAHRDLIDLIDREKPMRIVQIRQSNDHRGWLRFSNDQESIAALVSEQCSLRITGLSTDEFILDNFSGDLLTVDLPEYLIEDDDLSSVTKMIRHSITGDWGVQIAARISHPSERSQNSYWDRDPSRDRHQAVEILPTPRKREEKQMKTAVDQPEVEILPSPPKK